MIYTLKCEHKGCGAVQEISASIAEGPPKYVECQRCFRTMVRDWKTDAPMLDTSACRDHNFIPHAKRVPQSGGKFVRSKDEAIKRENGYREMIQNRRAAAREAGKKSIKQTMAIPAEIYHGKIKETGDRNYWSDAKNVSRHKDWEVSQ